jgi:phage tail sheath protein FI
MVGAEDLSIRVSEDDVGLLNHDAVNTFRLQRGVRPWGARTASSDPDWRYITVRRLFIMLRRSLEAGFAWVTFEPNNDKTWEYVGARARGSSWGICSSAVCSREGRRRMRSS